MQKLPKRSNFLLTQGEKFGLFESFCLA